MPSGTISDPHIINAIACLALAYVVLALLAVLINLPPRK